MNWDGARVGRILGYILGAIVILSVAIIPIVSFEVAFGILLFVVILWGVIRFVVSRERRGSVVGAGDGAESDSEKP